MGSFADSVDVVRVIDLMALIIFPLAALVFATTLALWDEHWVSTRRRRESALVGALMLTYYVGCFTAAHHKVSLADGNAYSEPLGYLDSAYFALTTVTTTGYGDIQPISDTARAVTTAQMASGFLLVVIVGALTLSRFAAALRTPTLEIADQERTSDPPSNV